MALNLKKLLYEVNVATIKDDEIPAVPLSFINTNVKPEWIDYNGHMNEAMYITATGYSYEAFAQYIGLTPEWVIEKGSYFTVENHCVHLKECYEKDSLYITTQIVDADEKKLHLLHSMYLGYGGDLLFTREHMLLYVNPKLRKVEAVPPFIYKRITKILNAHKNLPKDNVERKIGIKRK